MGKLTDRGINPVFRVKLIIWLSFFAIIAIGFMKAAPELEDAEQAYYSQWWRLGYDDQPPLYTWLQNVVNMAIGVSQFSFTFLRAVIFAGILFLYHRFAWQILNDKKKAALTMFLTALIPVFIDFTFRRLSHTALLCLLVILTYFMVHRLMFKKGFLNYLALGAIVGAGILTKYNYLLALAALFLTLFFDRDIRKIVFHRNFLVSTVVAMLMITPHVLWLLGDQGYITELKSSLATKTLGNSNNDIFLVSPFIAYVTTLLKLTAPLFIFFLFFIGLKKVVFKKERTNWLFKVLLSQLVVMLVLFLWKDINKIEQRWLLPLLLPFMVLLVKQISFKEMDTWIRTAFYIFFGIIVLQTVRTPIEKVFNIPSSVHFGFDPLAEKLRKNFADRHWVLPDVTYGGSVRLLNPDREIFTLDDFSLPPEKNPTTNKVLVVKDQQEAQVEGGVLLDSISNFGRYGEKLYIHGF